MLRVAAYNVNGIRAAARRGFAAWLRKRDPDVLCLQEVRANPDDIPAGCDGSPSSSTRFVACASRGGPR